MAMFFKYYRWYFTPYYIDWFGYDPDSLSIGTYNYKIIDSNSCEYTNFINVTGPDSLVVSANIVNVNATVMIMDRLA